MRLVKVVIPLTTETTAIQFCARTRKIFGSEDRFKMFVGSVRQPSGDPASCMAACPFVLFCCKRCSCWEAQAQVKQHGIYGILWQVPLHVTCHLFHFPLHTSGKVMRDALLRAIADQLPPDSLFLGKELEDVKQASDGKVKLGCIMSVHALI